MPIENIKAEFNPPPEQKEKSALTLDGLLEKLHEEGITTLPAEKIREQLNETGNAIVTREFACGIRIARTGGTKSRGYQYRTLTTNALENPDHPLAIKFGKKDIIIE